MSKVVDVKGLEFRPGCKFVWSQHEGDRGVHPREVVYAGNGREVHFDNSYGAHTYSQEALLEKGARIISYRSLAPDKNGKMINEGDTIVGTFGSKIVVTGMIGRYFLADKGTEFDFPVHKECTFVSRPTEDKNSEEIEALRKEISEAKEHLIRAEKKLEWLESKN